MLMANSTAILTDAFPANQRGMALGINMVAAIAGSFLGLLIGGVLSEWHWRAVFWVSVPIGIARHHLGVPVAARARRPHARAGSTGRATLTFGVGLTVLLAGITYGIQPYGDSHDRLDQPVGARRRSAAACCCWWRSASSRLRVAAADVRHPAVPIRVVRHGQPGRAAVLDRPRRPAVHADHLAAGHLAAAARLQLRVDAAVGRHLPAAADRRLPGGRPGRRARCPTGSAPGRSPSAACC